MATDYDRWPALTGRGAREQVMAMSVAAHVGRLPHPTDPKPVVTHKLVKVRSMVDNRYYNGKYVAIGDVIELPADEASGWIKLKWAAAATGAALRVARASDFRLKGRGPSSPECDAAQDSLSICVLRPGPDPCPRDRNHRPADAHCLCWRCGIAA
jgi:hypothetical protein